MVNWNYVVTAQRPTAVTHAAVGNFTSANHTNLIISKCTRIEIHLLTPEGLQPLLDVGIYGRIACMQLFRPSTERQDLLFISTERYKFCVLAFDEQLNEIVTRANGDIQDLIGRPADVGQISIIDPQTSLIGLHLYDGLFKAIPIDSRGQLKEAFNIRLEELHVLDMQFLHGHDEPTLVLLYQDSKELRHVKTYRVLLREKEFADGPWSLPNVESGASMLIPVPFGGALIVGEQSIAYVNGGNPYTLSMPPTLIRAYGRVDQDGSRYLLGDHQGQLMVLALKHTGGTVADMKLEVLGETSIASTISYLDNAVVFVGSGFGDSQLIKLGKPDEHGNCLEVIEQFTNLGPIVDFCVVDLEHLGQGQVVTCSGVHKDGSLRIVRNGIGITEHAAIELPGIKGLWSLKQGTGAVHDSFVVVSFITETRILALNGEMLEEAEIPGFDNDVQTLYCGNAIGDTWLQITEAHIRLVDCTTMQLVSQWTPTDGKINIATANESQILVALGGGGVCYLEIADRSLREVARSSMPHEVSSLALGPKSSPQSPSLCCAIGLWDISVRIHSLPDLRPLTMESLPGEVICRSILFATFEGTTYLMCALGDGHFFNFIFDWSTASVTERKKLALGTQQIKLAMFNSHNGSHVFACSDRPTVIYSSNKKLVYSNVNLKEVTNVCPFNSESFPDSLAIATETGLAFGAIDDIQKLHIRTVPLGEMPRRICHQEESHAFGVLTQRVVVDRTTGDETESHFLRIIDEQTFEPVQSFAFEPFEHGCSILSCTFADDMQPYFIVGTAFALPTESEPTRGRILVFLYQGGKLVQIAEKEMKGAIYCMASFQGKLIAGVNSKVHLLKWQDADGQKDLVVECSHHGHILALYLACRGDFIVVGDLMKSISLLAYKSVDSTLEAIARDFNPNWMTSVEMLDDDTFIGSENSFNLFTVRKNAEAATDEDRGRLETVGEFHLGEFVNKLHHGSLVMRMPDSESSALPTLVYGTVNGAIGVIASLSADQYKFFLRVQQNLAKVIRGIGGFDHGHWRSFSNERRTVEARGFLDGDLIESLLDLKRESVEEVAKGLDISAEELIRRVEELSRIH